MSLPNELIAVESSGNSYGFIVYDFQNKLFWRVGFVFQKAGDIVPIVTGVKQFEFTAQHDRWGVLAKNTFVGNILTLCQLVVLRRDGKARSASRKWGNPLMSNEEALPHALKLREIVMGRIFECFAKNVVDKK